MSKMVAFPMLKPTVVTGMSVFVNGDEFCMTMSNVSYYLHSLLKVFCGENIAIFFLNL